MAARAARRRCTNTSTNTLPQSRHFATRGWLPAVASHSGTAPSRRDPRLALARFPRQRRRDPENRSPLRCPRSAPPPTGSPSPCRPPASATAPARPWRAAVPISSPPGRRSPRLRAAALLADHRLAIEWSRLHGGVWPGPGEPAGGPDTLRVRRTPARCSRPGKRGYSRSESQISRRGGSSPTPGPCARSPSCPGRSAPPVSSCS